MRAAEGAARLSTESRLARHLPLIMAAVAVLIGLAFFWHYYTAGLTLVHYDAKARLLVARRIFDNATPGITQMGLYWLPLPALVNVPAVLNDRLYVNGVAASLLSVLFFGVSAWFLYRIVYMMRSDNFLAAAAVAVFITNPAMLYAQSTPLTEALYFAIALAASFFFGRLLLTEDRRDLVAAGACISLATLVRYDGWSLWAGLNLLFMLHTLRLKRSWRFRGRFIAAFAIVSTIGIICYQLYCFYATGQLFPPQHDSRPLVAYSRGDLIGSSLAFLRTAADVAGKPLSYVAAAGLVVFFALRRFRAPYVAAYALLHSAPLFILAYFNGHPWRVRYSLTILPAIALFAVVLWPARRWARIALATLIMLNLIRSAERRQGLLKEASYHAREIAERNGGIDYMSRNYDGAPVLISMGYLAPFLHDWGIPIRNTIHEGSYGQWDLALARPARIVGWIITEEGDQVWQSIQSNPRFLNGFEKSMSIRNFHIYRKRVAD